MRYSDKSELKYLINEYGFDAVIAALTEVVAAKSEQMRDINKTRSKEWGRASARLTELRVWCDRFGPDSNCR
jgi:hypothetical protein